MQTSTVNGTELGAQEWRDALFLQYSLEPPDLPTHCDICKAKFRISHTLDCKMGGLITAHHNNLCDGILDMVGKAFTPSHVRNDPLVFAGCAVKRLKAKQDGAGGSTYQDGAPPSESTEQKGDLLIRDLRKNGTDSVHDMRVVNTDAKSHSEKTSGKCLQDAESGKKRM